MSLPIAYLLLLATCATISQGNINGTSTGPKNIFKDILILQGQDTIIRLPSNSNIVIDQRTAGPNTTKDLIIAQTNFTVGDNIVIDQRRGNWTNDSRVIIQNARGGQNVVLKQRTGSFDGDSGVIFQGVSKPRSLGEVEITQVTSQDGSNTAVDLDDQAAPHSIVLNLDNATVKSENTYVKQRDAVIEVTTRKEEMVAKN